MSSAVDISYCPFTDRGTLADCIDALKSGIGGQSADYQSRLNAMDMLAKQVLSPESVVRQHVPTDGLAYLATYLQRSHLERLVSREMKETGALTGFVRLEPQKSIKAVPRGLVCHWVAGNIPLLAVFSWALSAVLGNRNLIRLSTRQNDLVSPFLHELRNCSEAGAAMADETVVVTFDSENLEANQLMSASADVRIAWGGKEAVDAIRGLPTDWECEDIVFGPRVSMGVVDPESIDEGGIRRLATDVAVFDQLACSSPQCIFVKSARESRQFKEFTTKFCTAFESQANNYPRHKLDFSETYQIGLDRTRSLLDGGEVFSDRYTDWTVTVVDRPNDTIQCANRFVQIIPFKSFEEIYDLIPVNIQTVVTQLGAEDLAEFTEQAAYYGVCRFPRPGEGNNFDNPWDGMGLVSRLTRTVLRTDAR